MYQAPSPFANGDIYIPLFIHHLYAFFSRYYDNGDFLSKRRYSRREKYAIPYNEDGTLPKPLENSGVKGLSYRKYDLTLCTSCWGLNMIIPTAIAQAWKGDPWNEVEILTGKVMRPTPGKKKTILIGKCIYQVNKDHPDIEEMIAIKGCPPKPKAIVKAFHQAGIELNPAIFENMDKAPGYFMKRYEGRPEFDEGFFRIE